MGLMLLVIKTEVQGEKAQLFDPNVPAHLELTMKTHICKRCGNQTFKKYKICPKCGAIK